MRVTVGTKLGLAFGAMTLLSLAIGGVAYFNLQSLEAKIEDVAKMQARKLDYLQEMKAHLLASVRAEKNMILASTDAETKKYADAKEQEWQTTLKVEADLYKIASPEGKIILGRFDQAAAKRPEIEKSIEQSASINSTSHAQDLITAKVVPAAKELSESLARINAEIAQGEATPDRLQLAMEVGRFQSAAEHLWGHTESLLSADDQDELNTAVKEGADAKAALRHSRDALKAHLDRAGLATQSAALAERFDRWLGAIETAGAIAAQNSFVAARMLSMGEGRQNTDQLLAAADEYVTLQRTRLNNAVVAASNEFETSRWTLIGVILVSVLVAIGAGSWIALAISRGLRRAVGLANAVAIGDLDQNISASGNDEIKDLIDALNGMTVNLNATAKVADTIAGGDLSVHVQRLSAKDRLGNALERMLGNLRHSVQQREHREAEKAEEAKNDQFAIDTLGQALGRLAGGDLAHRIETPFAAKTEKLRSDFNATVERLQAALVSVGTNTRAIRSGTGEISSAADDLSRRTEQQAASLEETAASLDEITATVRKTAEGAKLARDIVSHAKVDAEKSSDIVRQAIDAMSGIEKSSKQIGQIIGVIDEIAFQTNLLALNAGVEAARAGDAGRGFAVVASEVRALAQRSAEAAKEIKSLISASATQVDQGVGLVAEAGKALERIAGQVTKINDEIVNIAASAQEQATGLGQVNTAVNQMDQVTQQNAAMVEETTAAARTLSSETEELSNLIGRFHTGHGEQAEPARRKEPPRRARG
jgi:methyl-accepting chemotaxis protein